MAEKKQSVYTRVVQMNVLPGQTSVNTRQILNSIQQARKDNIQLLIFPEMAVPGYMIGDNWERTAFLRECEDCNNKIREAACNITVVFGSVAIDWNRRNEDGRVRKYNALYVAEDARFLSPANHLPYDFVIKSLLPDYREFEETRHFYDLRKLALEEKCSVEEIISPVITKNASLGCVLCEDAWDIDYNFSPLDILAQKNVDLFLSVSASPFTLGKNHKRIRVFSRKTVELERPMIYANCVGIQNNGKCIFTFDGSSAIYDGKGNITTIEKPFEESYLTCNVPLDGSAFGKKCKPVEDNIADIYRAVNYGTRRFLDACNIEKVVVGVSGGIDSAVVAAIYGRILSPDKLLLVNMPGKYNSKLTRNLASELAANIDCLYCEVPIEESCRLSMNQLDGLVSSCKSGKYAHTIKMTDPVMENVQARDRSARILAGLAAAFGGVFTCNANKSEVTVGYTTLYGDQGGYLANIADLWKTEVYELARYINNHVYNRELIPEGSIMVTPSAELSEKQDIEKNQGDPLIYNYHDRLFKSWVESWNRTTPEDIIQWYSEGVLENKIGYNGNITSLFPSTVSFITDLEKWWNAYQGLGLAKRIQAPPILAIKKRAFGFDLRESQIGSIYTGKYIKLKDKLLR